MSWNNITPVWVLMMPYDAWERGEISDSQLMAWLESPQNYVPPAIVENWRVKLRNKNKENAST
jgi:hypothetical protein